MYNHCSHERIFLNVKEQQTLKENAFIRMKNEL